MSKKVIKSAKGLNGILIKDIYGISFFRAYDSVGVYENFKDYDIRHRDMNVILDDDDAYIYKREDGSYFIDYSPQTLGYKTDDELKLEIITNSISDYFENGGSFTPEQMDYNKLRKLLMDIKDVVNDK